mmetsp:Transcript_2188/g.4663  ORF Transcript_2188/g.4663 Transcript_2188/m.4663 type:complete len:204 (+) Transcript_2188:72-683(+)
MGQRLYNIDQRLQCLMMGITTIASVPPMLYLLNTPSPGSAGFYMMCAGAGVLVNMNGPNVRVVLQNVVAPEVRGTAFAVYCLTDDVGKGLGPALVVLFIKACGHDRQSAFNLVVLFWIFCGSLLCLLALTVRRDEARVQTQVRLAVLLDQHRRTRGAGSGSRSGSRSGSGGGGDLTSFCEMGVGMELGGAENPLHSQLLKDAV